jgi:hypothetical protein
VGKLDFVLYTHTDYKDVWPLYFGQMKKYFPDASHVVFVNKEDSDIPENFRTIIYDDKLTYRERVLSCLKQLNIDYIIFHHEDMILYDTPDYDKLVKYVQYPLGHRIMHYKSDFIKLIRGGIDEGKSILKSDNESFNRPDLKHISEHFEYIFAIQPTIWVKEKFQEVFEYSKGNNIWEFEVAASQTCRDRKIYGYYVDDGGIQRGRYHWDSKVYPYIATAVVKGKWNTKEYPKELAELFIKYNIDPKIRGTNG